MRYELGLEQILMLLLKPSSEKDSNALKCRYVCIENYLIQDYDVIKMAV